MDDQSPPEAPQVPRLEGDDLFQWATLIAACRHAQSELDRFGKLTLARRGLRPDMVSVTNEGYIVPRRLISEMRSRAHDLDHVELSGNGTD